MSSKPELPTTEEQIESAKEMYVGLLEDGHDLYRDVINRHGQMVARKAKDQLQEERPELFEDDPSTAPIIENTGDVEVRDFNAVSDDHPLVQYAGQAAVQTDANGGGKFISEAIYDHDKAWVREWLQNHETACIRAAKLLIKLSDEYPDGWLKMERPIDPESGETIQRPDEADEVDVLEIPRPIDDVLEAARSLGYDPTIVWDIYRDERKITTEDNGIGMTPREFWEAFESPFASGSGVDGETGGQFGVGSESVRIVYGDEGGAEVESQSRRPGGHEAYRAYTYSGGATACPGEVDDDFRGTRFHIPVQDSFDLSNLQGWVEHYVEKLRVPLLYREHDAGSTPVEEEYEATNFVDDYDNPPVTIKRPGEFSVVAGPDVIDTSYHSDDEDTFLVSMPIDRNTRTSINTLWNVVIQIHDEQGLIVAGPHRGEYRDDVEELHEDDVSMPEPTGDRDRLNKNSASKKFFNYIQEVVKAEEMKRVSDIAEQMNEADHPADVIRGEPENWTLFRKMVHYHGHRRVTERRRKFKDFIDEEDAFPDFDDETVVQMFRLFNKVGHCHNGVGWSSKKSGRSQKHIGKILSHYDPETVFMAASTGGKFTDRFRTIEATYNEPEVIVIDGASKYDRWNELFGFDVLKEVPVTQGDDHDYVVPDSVHERNKRKSTDNSGKAEEVTERTLKIRNDNDNSSIDVRLTIEEAQDRLEGTGSFGNGKDKLVLFTSSQDTENISDHYDMAKYAAIASVSKTEYDELAGYDDVMTYSEFTDWSESALIATTDGAMMPKELVEDDRLVVLCYRPKGPERKEVVKLLGDDYQELRNHYLEDIRDQLNWATKLDGFDGGRRGDDVGEVPDDAKHDTLFAVAGPIVLNRAEWAFDDMEFQSGYNHFDIVGLKLTRNRFGYHNPTEWYSLNKSTSRYRLMVDTPNWDDSSDIYDMMPRNRDKPKAQIYLGLHDRGIDPAEKDPEQLRRLIAGESQ